MVSEAGEERFIVGPDFIQILQGNLYDSDVTLILCGESHEDAIDITRSPGGNFQPEPGWLSLGPGTKKKKKKKKKSPWSWRDYINDTLMFSSSTINNMGKKKQLQCRYEIQKMSEFSSAEEAKEWSHDLLFDEKGEDEVKDGSAVLLVYFEPSSVQNKKKKKEKKCGKAFLLVLQMYDPNKSSRKQINSKKKKKSTKSVYTKMYKEEVRLIDNMIQDLNDCLLVSSDSTFFTDVEGTQVQVFEWCEDKNDKDACQLNRSRLSRSGSAEDDNLKESDTDFIKKYDDLVKSRKKKLQKNENVWTFDDYFSLLLKSSRNDKKEDIHLILEGAIPPWELDFYTPHSSQPEEETQKLMMLPPPASDEIRCLDSDSECSSIDEWDPSNDGEGSYMDFLYRKFVSLKSEKTHCVDCRDLGCTSSRETSPDLMPQWNQFMNSTLGLDQNEKEEEMLDDDDDEDKWLEWKTKQMLRIMPSWAINRELLEIWYLKREGKLTLDDEEEDCEESDDYDSEDYSDEDEYSYSDSESSSYYETADLTSYFPENVRDDIAIPSFEGFFAQASDILYYSQYIKASYSPFLYHYFLVNGNKGIHKFKDFMMELFFGGTIGSALSMIGLSLKDTQNDMDHRKQHLYIRSPIQIKNSDDNKEDDNNNNNALYKLRQEDEENVTFPYLPIHGFITTKANHSSADNHRTWSSHLYNSVLKQEGAAGNKSMAQNVKKYIVESYIDKCLENPKQGDMKCFQGGGEWFLAYLRAAHRDVYDNIPEEKLVDPYELLISTDEEITIPTRNDDGNETAENEIEERKVNLHDIQIPSCEQGMHQIKQFFENHKNKKSVSEDIEVMAKIMIDIYMSNLVDFSALLKILDIVLSSRSQESSTEKKKTLVVCVYMGSIHTQTIAKFFEDTLNFKTQAFTGQHNWKDEKANKKLQLPSTFWDIESFSM